MMMKKKRIKRIRIISSLLNMRNYPKAAFCLDMPCIRIRFIYSEAMERHGKNFKSKLLQKRKLI